MKFGKNMSRIGKQEILIPDGVEIKINGTKVEVKGPKGSLKMKTLPEILIEKKDNTIHFSPKSDDLKSKAYWGLTRTLVVSIGVKVISIEHHIRRRNCNELIHQGFESPCG